MNNKMIDIKTESNLLLSTKYKNRINNLLSTGKLLGLSQEDFYRKYFDAALIHAKKMAELCCSRTHIRYLDLSLKIVLEVAEKEVEELLRKKCAR